MKKKSKADWRIVQFKIAGEAGKPFTKEEEEELRKRLSEENVS